MSKLTCPCGYRIPLSDIPNPNEYVIVPDSLLERIVDEIAVLADDAQARPHLKRDLCRLFRRHHPPLAVAYECPNCGRLLVFRGYNGMTVEGTLVYRVDDTATRVKGLKSFFSPDITAENKAP